MLAVINFLLYLILWLYIFLHHRREKSALFVSSLWTLSSFAGIFYVQSNEYRTGGHELSLLPFVYMFVCFYISLIPFIKQKHRIEIISCKYERLLYYISFTIVIVSVIPFFELVFTFYKLIVSGEFLLLGSHYDAIATGSEDSIVDVSAITNQLQSYCRSLKTVTPILLFYYLQKSKLNLFLIVGLFCSSMVPSLYNMTIGNRTELIWMGLYYSFLYVVLHQVINIKHMVKVRAALSALAIITILSFSVISIGRYVLASNTSGDYGDVFGPILQYASESMYNFNSFAFHEDNPMLGHQTANSVIDFFNGTNSSLVDVRNYLDYHMKSPSWYFYSFIGDFYIDYGFFGACFIIAIISSFFSMVRFRVNMPIERLMLYSIYIYMIVNGIFYFCYMMSWNPIKYTVIIYTLLRIIIYIKKENYFKNTNILCK